MTDPKPADDSPDVISGKPAPMPTKAEAEAAWRRAYIAQMVMRGVDLESAEDCCNAIDCDLSERPEDAADSELSYWTSDE